MQARDHISLLGKTLKYYKWQILLRCSVAASSFSLAENWFLSVPSHGSFPSYSYSILQDFLELL